jgi:hypothetical protein
MKNTIVGFKALRIFFRGISLSMVIFIAFLFIRQPVKPLSNSSAETQVNTLCPLFTRTNIHAHDAYEKRIARHFAVDTMPGLMQAGLLRKYQRTNKGTRLFVTGKMWKARSQFFRTCLLTEVFTYNKVNGYELSTAIIDGISGKLYARISSSAKMEFYD